MGVTLVLPHILLVRSGVTALDLQGRISGRLDVPLAAEGEYQMEHLAGVLAGYPVAAVVTAPGMSSVQSGQILARKWRVRPRSLGDLANLDFGLWHGRSVDELQRTQPRLFRCLEESPELVCPPKGEPIVEARRRVAGALGSLGSRQGNRLVAVVVPGPIAAIVRGLYLGHPDFDDRGIRLWWEPVGEDSWFQFASQSTATA